MVQDVFTHDVLQDLTRDTGERYGSVRSSLEDEHPLSCILVICSHSASRMWAFCWINGTLEDSNQCRCIVTSDDRRKMETVLLPVVSGRFPCRHWQFVPSSSTVKHQHCLVTSIWLQKGLELFLLRPFWMTMLIWFKWLLACLLESLEGTLLVGFLEITWEKITRGRNVLNSYRQTWKV